MAHESVRACCGPLTLTSFVCVCVWMHAVRAAEFVFFQQLLGRDEMNIILKLIRDDDLYVLALQSRDLYAACYNEYTGRMHRPPAQRLRWYTSASCTASRLNWARHEFPHPHLFVPNAKSLEVIAVQGQVARYEQLCNEMPELRETLAVYRKAGASGNVDMIVHLRDKNNSDTHADITDREDRVRCLLGGAALFNHVLVFEDIFSMADARKWSSEIFSQAICNRSADVVMFMLVNAAFPHTEDGRPEPFAVVNLFEESMKHGRHEILRILHEFFRKHLSEFPQQGDNVMESVSNHLVPSRTESDLLWAKVWAKEWRTLPMHKPDTLATFMYAVEEMKIPYLSLLAERTTFKAIKFGDVDLVTYIHERPHPISEWAVSTWCAVFQRTSLDMAKHVHKLYPHIPDQAMNTVIAKLLSGALFYRSQLPDFNLHVVAIEKKCINAVDWLVDLKVKCTAQHVATAVTYGSVSVLQRLVDHKAPVDKQTVLEHAVHMLNPERVMFAEHRFARFHAMANHLRDVHSAQWSPSCLRDASAYLQSIRVQGRWPELVVILQQMIAEGANPEDVQDAALRRRLSLRRPPV